MDLPREVIKWIQYLNLSYAIKNVKDISNGILVAEILNIYMPQSIHMNSLENGASKEIKKKNWAIIKKVLIKFNILFEEMPIINGEKDEIIDFMIKLYEFFNQEKHVKEIYFVKDENKDIKVPCYARPTIAQKVRESDIHDIVDEQKRMIRTYDIVEKEEKRQQMLKKKIIQEKEKSVFNKDATSFNELHHISSIATIPDITNCSNYTEIKTLDSFVNDRDNKTLTTLKNNLKESYEKDRHQTIIKSYEDENVDTIIANILVQHLSDNDMKICIEKLNNKIPEKIKGAFPLYKFLAISDKTAVTLSEKFHILCLMNKKEVVNKILEQMQQFNEKFQRILSLKTYQFTHIWKMFFPIITSSEYDNEIRASVTDYLKQFLEYLQINDVLTMELLCNVILRSLFLIDDVQNKELKYLCELIVLLINDDKHICINILHMSKNIMPINFFYVLLSTLLDKSLPSFKQKKDVKDIFYYYIFVGLHSLQSGVIWCTINMLYTLSVSEEYEDIIFLSNLLLNITELNNPNYDVYLFIISANIIAKIEENKKNEIYKKSVQDFVQICFLILEKTSDREMLYLYFLHAYKIISNDNILDIVLKKYENLSVEEQKGFFADDIFATLFKKWCNYKSIEERFSKVFNININELNKINNKIILQSLLDKNEWEKKSRINFLRNTILYDGSINCAKFLEIYKTTYKHFVSNLIKKNKEIFEVSKDMLDCFWHWPHKTEINEETFKISSSFIKEIYSANMHQLPQHSAEYFKQLKSME